jgi:CheY-like chemotaxis protein
LRDLLVNCGIPAANIQQSEDGKGALERLEIRRPDFIITEWQMTPMDGLALTRHLRHPDTTPAPGIPVILCTGNIDTDLLKDARMAGINEIIVKPVNAGAISGRVTAVLERPRPVITLPNYIGPDRRRVSADWDGIERRAKDRDVFL